MKGWICKLIGHKWVDVLQCSKDDCSHEGDWVVGLCYRCDDTRRYRYVR